MEDPNGDWWENAWWERRARMAVICAALVNGICLCCCNLRWKIIKICCFVCACTVEMNTQWDVSVPDSTLAAYVDDVLAPLLNGKTDEKPAAVAEVKHLAPGEERTRRHTMPSIPSCTELFVSTTDVSTTDVSHWVSWVDMQISAISFHHHCQSTLPFQWMVTNHAGCMASHQGSVKSNM